MDPLRRQETPQHRVECGIYFGANTHVVDDLCILRQIPDAA
jgi:hypothetical protein